MRWHRTDRVPVTVTEGRSDMSTSTVTPVEDWVAVTPAMADQWLQSNEGNRRLSQPRALRFAEDMEAGRWPDYHPHGISFDDTGRLIDGQHRLEAIALSGKTVIMRVTSGLPTEMMNVFDLGAPRTPADILRRNGIQNSTHAGAVAAMLYRYDTLPDVPWGSQHVPSKPRLLQIIMSEDVSIQDGIRYGQSAYRQTGMPLVQYALLYVLVTREGLEHEWTAWHEGIMSGVGLQRGDARLTLRNYVARTDVGRRNGDAHWHRQKKAAIILKAFRYYLDRRPVHLLKFEKTNLPMPTIV
jgi:hypothetical protein